MEKIDRKKESGETLKILRTDNGGEFTSSEFEAYLKSEGVRHELTIPKTPEQNGTAEHMNRTLVEAAHSMLSGSHLPPKFWAEALSTAVYVRNRSPTKALSQMTPQEAWRGEKPSVDHFRVFGCHSYVHIPKDERKKQDLKSKKSIFLGYGSTSKGYRLYNFTKKKVILSRDVIFNEQKFGHDDIGQETESHKYVYFDCFDDISDSDSHTVEKCPANTTEDISANNDASSVMYILNKRKGSLIDMVFHAIVLLLKPVSKNSTHYAFGLA